ncbi:MAG: VCBS repeat-containing protein [Bacteroidota bacterium]
MNRYSFAMARFYMVVPCIFVLFSCSNSKKEKIVAGEKQLFTLLDSTSTNILFNNTVREEFDGHVDGFYQGFYSGGGVAIGDLNNDGLDDIYFSGNMNGNKLYRNLGNMKFADITEAAGVGARIPGWKNGVNMVDVNGDGKLDIYVCYAGRQAGPLSKNQLFINQGTNKRRRAGF